ncbi:MAG TPA: pitrilysin family protein [Candidatus Saccharimonadales bacterium]|nr:pitrilysin family protein [Candidatus Saccharimonadales bacterium]
MKHSVEEIVLENGMRGLLIDVPEATVMNFRFNLRAGDYFAPPEQVEAAHLMEHMVLGANERFRTARKFNAEFQKNGAYNNAITSYVSMDYVAECADFEWERVLDLLLLAMSKPYFTQEEFEAEFGNVKEELIGYLNSHNRILHDELAQQFDASGRYKTDSQHLETLKEVDISAVKAHYKKTHLSDNIRFVIAGRIHGRKRRIEQLLGEADFGRGERFAYPTASVKGLDRPFYIDRQEFTNMLFGLRTFKLRRLSDDEQDALSMVDTMLTDTLHSLILGEAREKGLVYGIWSAFDAGSNTTSWDFGAQVSQENIEALFDIVIKQIQRIQRGDIDRDDIEMAKQYRLGAFQMGSQTVGSFVRRYGGRYFFDGTIDDYSTIPERIKSVNKTRMVDAVRTMFEDNVWGLGVLSKDQAEYSETLRKKLEALWG